MQIILNGETKAFEQLSTVADLLEQLGLTGKRLAVEINEEIIPRSEFSTHAVNDNDTIEIVRAIGGG